VRLRNESSRENQTDAETSTAALDCIYDVYISPEQAAMGHTRKLFINDRHYDVHMPGNLSDQQRIRMKGLGSSNGVTSGDLYIGTPEKVRSTAAQLVSAIETR